MIDEEQYITTQHQLVTLAGLVKDFPLLEFINAANRVESLGPLLDPTLYRAAADKLSDVKALAEALLPFKKEVVRQLNKAAQKDTKANESTAVGGKAMVAENVDSP